MVMRIIMHPPWNCISHALWDSVLGESRMFNPKSRSSKQRRMISSRFAFIVQSDSKRGLKELEKNNFKFIPVVPRLLISQIEILILDRLSIYFAPLWLFDWLFLGVQFLCGLAVFAFTWASWATALVLYFWYLLFASCGFREEECDGNERKNSSRNWDRSSSTRLKVIFLA